MKTLICIFLAMALAACAGPVQPGSPLEVNTAVPTQTTSTPIPSTPTTPATVSTINKAATAAPVSRFADATATFTPTPGNKTAPSATSTPLPLTPTTISRAGWKTYTSMKLQVAIDYPPDWSVREDANGTTFTSPQGAMINLSEINASTQSQEPLPNTRCTTHTNSHGVNMRVCLDTIAFSYNATATIKTPSDVSHLITLVTRSKGDTQIFNAMVESIRPVA